jgi:hypothetical protein
MRLKLNKFSLGMFVVGPAPTGTGTIALDPTFGSFTLLKSVSHYMNWFLW